MAVQIPVLQTSGEPLTVEVGPEMTLGDFKADLQRQRWEDPLMRNITDVKILVDNLELLPDGRMVLDAVSPDATVQVIFSERSFRFCNKEEGRGLLQDSSRLCVLYIPEGVTVIPNRAFAGCTSIAKVIIPESVAKIGWRAFEECSSLTQVNIPESVTEISQGAFRDCTSLSSVTIPESVTVIPDGAFAGCTSIAKVIIPQSVTKIGYRAFKGCRSLAHVTIPESVTEISAVAFRDCTSLSIVTISPVTYINISVMMRLVPALL